MGKLNTEIVKKKQKIRNNPKTSGNIVKDDSRVYIIGLSSVPNKVILKFDDKNFTPVEEESIDTIISKENQVETEEYENNLQNLQDEEAETDESNMLRRKSEFETEALPHMKILRNYASKLVGNEFDADDLVQDTFVRAYRFFDQFEMGTNCKAWLFRIMKNLFINNYKKNQKQPAKVNYDDVENFYENIRSDLIASNDLQETVYKNLFDDELTRALNSMPDEFKTVVILCDIEELSYEEIADFVKCPVGTIRSRLHRGRKMLHQKLLSYARKRGYEANSPVYAY